MRDPYSRESLRDLVSRRGLLDLRDPFDLRRRGPYTDYVSASESHCRNCGIWDPGGGGVPSNVVGMVGVPSSNLAILDA